MIDIVWDEPKRQANLVKHGLDFASVPVRILPHGADATAKAGRYQALGLLAGRPVVVIFKPLGSEAFALISLRPASAAERTEL